MGALCAWSAGAQAATASPAHRVFAVVSSPDVPAEDLNAQDVRRLMLGERRFWNSRMPVTALMPNLGSPSRDFLLGHLFHMTERSYRRHTLELLYRGELDYAPLVMGSPDEALAFVAAGHGAITIVPLELLTNTSVRVLRVNGKLPQDAGYAFDLPAP